MTRIGILGGTFDPIHLGHLVIASFAADELSLDRVLFMPAQTPPHKRDRTITDAEHRVHMVQQAIGPDARFAFSDLDLTSDVPSYTSHLLARLTEKHRQAQLYFIIGADSLVGFPTWYEPTRILDVATLAVARRPGYVLDDCVLDAMPRMRERSVLFDAPLIDISSSSIRQRIAERKRISWLVPFGVERYIRTHDLYR